MRGFAKALVVGTLVLAAGMTLSAAPSRAQQPVALELVLAVDASSSVDDREFRLQMQGIADAFRDNVVRAAIVATVPRGGVAVSLMQWSDASKQVLVVGWTRLVTPAAALALAQRIENTPRAVQGGATAIGTAVNVAISELTQNEFQGRRRAIDVSGDGRANQGDSPAFARARANRLGITINGLVILNEEPTLDRYYRAGVVGGPNAFMMTVDGFEDFAEAIRDKLLAEIQGPPIAAPPVQKEKAAATGAAASIHHASLRPGSYGTAAGRLSRLRSRGP